MEEQEVKESKITLREKGSSKDISIEDMSFSELIRSQLNSMAIFNTEES